MSSNIRIPKTCAHCGTTFIAKTTATKYCSHTCNRRHYKKLQRQKKMQDSMEDFSKVQEPSVPYERIPMHQKEYLSIQQAADLLGVSRWTIQRLVAKGTFKAGKVGRRTIIPKSEIQKLFK